MADPKEQSLNEQLTDLEEQEEVNEDFPESNSEPIQVARGGTDNRPPIRPPSDDTAVG